MAVASSALAVVLALWYALSRGDWLNGLLAGITLAMSLLGTWLAALGGLLLALPASARRHEGAGSALATTALRGATRGALNGLRSVPELVWAALLVIAAGLGPFAGTLALALHTTGVLGRLFAENLENAAPEPAFALRVRGVGALRVFLFATLPQIWPQVIAYTLYRWENNIRAAAVLGVVGAGGLGQMLYYHLSLFQMHESCTVLGAMMALVALVDALTWMLNQKMIKNDPLIGLIAAISVGIVKGEPLLDLEYTEDSACDTDMNVVINQLGGIIEIQGTAEGAAFSRQEVDALMDLAEKGVKELVQAQQKALNW